MNDRGKGYRFVIVYDVSVCVSLRANRITQKFMDGFATNVHIRRILSRGQTTKFLTLGTFAQLANFGPLITLIPFFVKENPSMEKFFGGAQSNFLAGIG